MKKLLLVAKLFTAVFFMIIPASHAITGAAAIKRLPAEKIYTEFLWSFENHGQPYRIDSETYGQPGKPGADIQLLKAWSIQSEAADIKIAVIDGDFDLEHPDLKNIFDVGLSWNFVTNQGPIKSPADERPHHGTMVAGVIGADGLNQIGITGIVRKSHIIPIQALPDSGDEDDQQIAQAINYAVDHQAKIINISFGKFTTAAIVEQAISRAQKNNVLIVASAGNGRHNVDQELHWPSGYSVRFDNVISVAATNRSDRLYSDSNYGSSIDIAAPGHEIFTTANPAKTIKYSSFSGTSAAAPHVTGVAALMLALDSKLTPAEIKDILIRTADPIESTNGYQPGFGRLNAYRALTAVKNKAKLWAADHGNTFDCNFSHNKKEYLRSKSKIGYRWELANEPSLFQPWQGQDAQYNAYRGWVAAHNNTGDFRAILQTHIDAGKKILERLDSKEDLAKSILEDQKFVLSIMQGSEGEVNPISCIESIVFREFLNSNESVQSKKEFTANIFQQGTKIILLGEWDTEEDDSGFIGATESPQLKRERSNLIGAGWKLLAHFHNHPFNFENKWGDIGGGLAPSDADLSNYKTLKPATALITNGLDTIRFDESLWLQR